MADNNWLTAEWMQSALNALHETLDVNPALKRQMIEFLIESGLWSDESKWDSALNRFNACLNPARPQVFKLGEIWALMRRFDRHDLFHSMARDLGYEVRKVASEQRHQEALERLAAAIEASTAAVAEARAELARLEATGAEMRVHPTVRDKSAAFSVGEF